MDVQITVASKVPGAPGKKQSKIIDTTGKSWQVWNDKFHMFQEGNSYLITKHATSEFNGATYYKIEAFTPVSGAARAVLNGATPEMAARYPVRHAVDNSKIDEQRRMDIFICGAFNNIMANPNVHPVGLGIGEMAALVNELRQVWLTTLGPNRPNPISTSAARMEPQQPPAHNADLDDQVPF